MIIYVICGFSICKDFAATSLLCQYLKSQYPNNFHYRKVVTHKVCYKAFAKAVCEKFGWKEFTNSPMIWKQHNWVKGKATFIGDENKFQELMNEIYGVETFVPCEEKINLAKDEHNFFLEQKRIDNTPEKIERRVVCILNASHTATRLLVAEILLGGRPFQKKDGVEIRLLEEDASLDDEVADCVRDATIINVDTDTGNNIIKSVKSLEEGLLDCDLLILMPQESPHEKSNSINFEESSVESWRLLAQRLNHITLSCKICLFPCEHSCFHLNCLAEFLHKVRAFDIVGVTEDLALNVLSEVSTNTKLSKQNLIGVPSVWGYVGVKHLVDICSTEYDYKRVTPEGDEHTETRTLMPYHDHLQHIWEERKTPTRNFLNQVSATVDLINEWFADKPTGRVFSAAVLSDGTFDIPSGLYFSQPVRCIDHEWVPDVQHALPQEPIAIHDLYGTVLPKLQSLEIGRKWNSIWLSDSQKNSYEFLKETQTTQTKKADTIKVQDKPMTNGERYELKKYLGKRNQLYPDEYKTDRTTDIDDEYTGDATEEEGEEEHVVNKIMWDQKEPFVLEPAHKLDFLLDEYIVGLMTEYGVEDEELGEEEGLSEEVEEE